jgi:hypothetical protein
LKNKAPFVVLLFASRYASAAGTLYLLNTTLTGCRCGELPAAIPAVLAAAAGRAATLAALGGASAPAPAAPDAAAASGPLLAVRWRRAGGPPFAPPVLEGAFSACRHLRVDSSRQQH